ncbi:Glycosyl transferase family 2 [Loktanella fryxellensis]|uniref:Glycosyl transferase family 2 n=1 Tax=Loktanella fryxellensis TaxID=245187 RepID=A0A1H7YWH7_9RHOB|nr:glycosyltransferase family 2 protein [Loktanella fryxellensis]SEM50622.1 Glycosyl transferase family 2 [Loktanella fryxellensis]
MAGSQPVLSVILTYYDETPFLQMAVSSVAAQGIDGIELIIVNDNPARFSQQDFDHYDLPAFARVVHHAQNLGLSAARNTGLSHATGTHVGFLDGDDYYVAGGLAAQLAHTRATGACITHAQCYVSRLRSPQVDLLRRDRLLFGTPRTGEGLTAFEEAQFITSSWSSLYRRDFLTDNALAFDPAQRKFEDRLFVLQTVTAARRIATLGRPTRVWRRRAGSISVTRGDPDLHRLQVQLLEKCVAHVTDQSVTGRLPPRFLKREHFNTFSRVIWDLQIIDAIATADHPAYGELGQRIAALLDGGRFGHAIFDDPVLAPVNRVGLRSRQGVIGRTDIFALHRMLRDADFAGAAALLADRRAAAASPPPARPMVHSARPRLILHVGLHKTGTTYLQHQLLAQRAALLDQGILVPLTGLTDHGHAAIRAGGQPGHQGLLGALRRDDPKVWQSLEAELAQAAQVPIHTVVVSCENMLLPLADDRDERIRMLAGLTHRFASAVPVVTLRRPDHQIESFWREIVCNGQRMGARSLEEFTGDTAPLLCDLPALIGPVEALTGERAILLDFDAARARDGLWADLCTAIGMTQAPTPVPVPRYPSAGPRITQAARLINALIPETSLRIATLRDLFAVWPAEEPGGWTMPVSMASHVLDRFEIASAAYAAERGYVPPFAAWRADLATTPRAEPAILTAADLARLRDARLRCERPDRVPAAAALPRHQPPPMQPEADPVPAQHAARPAPRAAGPQIVIRPRPWLVHALRRVRMLR